MKVMKPRRVRTRPSTRDTEEEESEEHSVETRLAELGSRIPEQIIQCTLGEEAIFSVWPFLHW